MDRRERKKRTCRLWCAWVFVLVTVVLATGCQEQATSDVSGASSDRKIHLGYPALSATVFPLVYAQEKGIFEQEGVDVEMNRIRGVARIVATLISGDIDVGWMGFDGMTNAVSEGAEELRYVGEFLKELPQNLVVSPDIQTFDDLRGQTIATAGTGSHTDTLFFEGLKRGGLLNPRQDTHYLNLAGAENRLTQLLNGTVVASSLKVPFAQLAEERGFRILQYQGNLMEPWGGEGLVTHTRVISSKGEALEALVASMIRAVEEMQQKRAEAVAVAAKYLALEPAMAEKVYDHMMPIFKADGRWNPEGIQRTLDEKTGPERKMDVTRFVDDAFLRP
jgi:NitT/TauT family transport system substrate-binding protein